MNGYKTLLALCVILLAYSCNDETENASYVPIKEKTQVLNDVKKWFDSRYKISFEANFSFEEFDKSFTQSRLGLVFWADPSSIRSNVLGEYIVKASVLSLDDETIMSYRVVFLHSLTNVEGILIETSPTTEYYRQYGSFTSPSFSGSINFYTLSKEKIGSVHYQNGDITRQDEVTKLLFEKYELPYQLIFPNEYFSVSPWKIGLTE